MCHAGSVSVCHVAVCVCARERERVYRVSCRCLRGQYVLNQEFLRSDEIIILNRHVLQYKEKIESVSTGSYASRTHGKHVLAGANAKTKMNRVQTT